MSNLIYKNMDEKSKHLLLKTLSAKTFSYEEDSIISYYFGRRSIICIVEEGSATLTRYDYNGDRTILETLSVGDIFSDMFFESSQSEIEVRAASKSVITFISYDELLSKAEPSKTVLLFLNNLISIISNNIIKLNERIELLTTRSIRNKLLAYFEMLSRKNNSKSFDLPLNYTSLADYLAVDRSALMRELKSLKDDNIIKDINKRITLLY